MLLERIPETNDFGLVLPPDPDDLEYLAHEQPKKLPDSVSRHHLYWPWKSYFEDPLAWEFREHNFNSVWLLDRDHVGYHKQFEGVPIPPVDVMEVFLDEAALLESLNVCVRAIEIMDVALYEGRVRQVSKTQETRSQRLETIQQNLERAAHLEIVTGEVARLAVERATTTMTLADVA